MNKDNASKRRIIKNYILNAVYQVFLLIVPLILTPYVSRTLLPSGVGRYSYSNSIISYFTLFAALGTSMYGQREIAKYQGQIIKQSKIFWEIIIFRVLFTALSFILNLIFITTNVYGDYSLLLLILSINILVVAFDVSFLFQGNEQYGKMVLRNVIVKVVGVVLIYSCVKVPEDLWKYALINSMIVLISNLSLWVYLPKMVCNISLKELKPFKHLKSILILFIPTITVSIYTVLDKTLIGLILKNDAENGYFAQSETIVKMCVTVITCLSTVMISRNSIEYAKGNIEKLKDNIYFAVRFVWCLATPLAFGLVCVAYNMNYWFFGPGYESVIKLMIAFCPIILSLGLNNILGVQYLIAIGRDRLFTVSVVFGATLNVIMNIILISTIGTVGAVVSSVAAETMIFIIQLIMVRKELSISRILVSGWKNIVSSVIMAIILYLLYRNLSSSLIHTVCIIITGMVIYFASLCILRDDMVWKLLGITKEQMKKYRTKI